MPTLIVVLVAIALAAVTPAAASSSSSPTGTAAEACAAPMYVSHLRTSHVSCHQARRMVREANRAGCYHGKAQVRTCIIEGFSCRDTIDPSGVSDHMRCVRGDKVVRWGNDA